MTSLNVAHVGNLQRRRKSLSPSEKEDSRAMLVNATAERPLPDGPWLMSVEGEHVVLLSQRETVKLGVEMERNSVGDGPAVSAIGA